MAENNEEEDYKMKMYEAQAIVIEKEEEIDKMRREMDELRRRLEEQRLNDSLAEDSLPNTSISLSARVSSIEDQVKNAVAVLTRNIVSLQQTVRELSERGEKTVRNWRISRENSDRRNRQAVEEWEAKMETMREEMKYEIQNEIKELKIETRIDAKIDSLRNEVLNGMREHNNLVIENNDTFKKKINDPQKIDEMERETSKLKSKVYPPQILVLGGWDGRNDSSDIFLLDFYGKIWKKVSTKLPQKICGHGTVILKDELYIIGGNLDRNVYRLDKKMKWKKLANMHDVRAGITNSCISHNGCMWVIGGGTSTIEKYDPATDEWEEKPDMKRWRDNASAAAINDRIYVCGGIGEGMDSVEVFDISSEVWTDFCTLPQLRRGMSIIVDGTSIVLFGGEYEMKGQKTVWKMDVEGGNKKWIHLPPLNEYRGCSAAVMIETGCILVVGGSINDQTSSSVAIFSGQKWESFTPLPQPCSFHTTVVLTPAMIDAFRPFVFEK